MFKKIKQNKTISTLVFLFLLFLLSTKGAGAVNRQLYSIEDGGIEEINKETLEILLELKSLKLDFSLLETELFESLSDFNLELQKKPTGRMNPFKIFTEEELSFVEEEDEPDTMENESLSSEEDIPDEDVVIPSEE